MFGLVKFVASKLVKVGPDPLGSWDSNIVGSGSSGSEVIPLWDIWESILVSLFFEEGNSFNKVVRGRLAPEVSFTVSSKGLVGGESISESLISDTDSV